ncbi:MAG: hypothetical protein PHD46_04595 [Eubacteriales bacterium]|nr:hypothetical protein [Eubacteriales bacterium]MDD4422297.1 hypothetical protein [Eubacteriales bacterium]HBR32919.1 hypothetical protein [Clostridiales bacterium]
MKNRNKAVEELESLYKQKNTLLRSVVRIYSGVMESLEKDDFDIFLSKLDEVSVLGNTIELIDEKISAIEAESGIFPDSGDAGSDCLADYNNLADAVSASDRLLKNCNVLNEKLTYSMSNAKQELQKKIENSKNRKIIKEGYDAHTPVKSGLSVYC